MKRQRETTVYLQYSPKGYADLRLEKATMRKPSGGAEAGCIMVAVTVRIPDSVFQPITPAAVLEIPEELVDHTIELGSLEAQVTHSDD